MSGISKKLMGTTAAGGEALAIEDVFSTYLWAGNNTSQTINNGIDLAGEGGLVWVKVRNQSYPGGLYDTERGVLKQVNPASTDGTNTRSGSITAFNSDGFSIGNDTFQTNGTGNNYASWTFRKAPRFFDCVEYTGDGVAGRTVSHNLGTTVGCVMIKNTSNTENWMVYHIGSGIDGQLNLNSAAAATDDSTQFNDTVPSSTVLTLGSNAEVNANGQTYVAYLFAHDPLGPSEDGSDGLIACGSYTGNGSSTAGPVVELGWEPQWLLVKRSDSTADWKLVDNMRGLTAGSTDAELTPNLNTAQENTGTFVDPTSTGFQLNTIDGNYNTSGGTYIYIAIRRGPMRAPESGTEVFAIDTMGSTSGDPAFKSNFVVDMALYKRYNDEGDWAIPTRLMGLKHLKPNSTDAEIADGTVDNFAFNTGYNNAATNPNYYSWMWKRAPEFFDVVAYSGQLNLANPATFTVPHNLGVIPELVIVKSRTTSDKWSVGSTLYPDGGNMVLNENVGIEATNSTFRFNYAGWTDSLVSFGSNADTGRLGNTYIAYLFATLAGISKVGSYTGNGSSQTINCGFTTGARFILIKRTDFTGDWYVWDTARGIVTGNDPHLSLNTTAAEVTTDDSIDPDSSGFIVNQLAATNINVSSASYIFYAVA
jgi:hypothetical protein